ncbi:MAG: cyclic lactone autoinducer peptide [Clostridiales bacterium]|nr:cyclic lactone autoinducer peptide [Clostridiales bacterium]
MKKAIFSVISVIAVFVATLVASSACLFYIYQPNEPESLRDE